MRKSSRRRSRRPIHWGSALGHSLLALVALAIGLFVGFMSALLGWEFLLRQLPDISWLVLFGLCFILLFPLVTVLTTWLLYRLPLQLLRRSQSPLPVQQDSETPD